ncbi:hypothetical protein EWP97_21360, partial [Salmonella enterica]|nr:hypothetical protein [Salmonella enterica]
FHHANFMFIIMIIKGNLKFFHSEITTSSLLFFFVKVWLLAIQTSESYRLVKAFLVSFATQE